MGSERTGGVPFLKRRDREGLGTEQVVCRVWERRGVIRDIKRESVSNWDPVFLRK